MLVLLDIRFSFLCRSTHKNEQGKNPIILRVKFNNDRRDLFTGLYCSKEDWDSTNRKVLKSDKSFVSINQNLEVINRKANNIFDTLRFSQDGFTIDELVDKIKGKDKKPELLIDFLEEELKKVGKRVGVDLTKSSYYRYRRVLRYMKDFLQSEFKMRNYTIRNIEIKFITSYFQYLRREKQLCHNSALKFINMFKAHLQPAMQLGVIKGNPFRELKISPKPIKTNYLTDEEIERIISTNYNDPDLDRKRDIFLFACYTGLSFIDLKSLTGNNIFLNRDGSRYIRLNRQKTGIESFIPLLPAAERLLLKYSTSGDPKDFHWFVSSNQKMNKGLKSIGRRCGISIPLHMHLARHTFATTITLSNDISLESVSKMLGHSSVRMTQHYAKIVSNKVKREMVRIDNLYQ